MDALEAIDIRRSVRSYRADPVPEEKITEVVGAAIKAPSAGNVQPFKIVVVMEASGRESLARAAWGQNFVAQAPVAIVFLVDLEEASTRYGARGQELYSLLDVGAAIENLMLAAQANGLGTCWVGAFKEEEAARAINAPPGLRPVSIVSLGYASGEPKRRAKKSIDRILVRERFP